MEMGRGRGWPRNQIRGGVWIVRGRSQEHLLGDRFGGGKYPGKGRAKVGRFPKAKLGGVARFLASSEAGWSLSRGSCCRYP